MSAEKTSNTTWILSSSKECSAVSGKIKQYFIYQGGTIITRCAIRQQAYTSVDNCFKVNVSSHKPLYVLCWYSLRYRENWG